ncbi:MAG: 2-vinyl bacteriochlorophyllide hydratase [Hyphomicrobiales bacterium]|nr:MAG: 2-vinyl bacteriochlorophyllide hydratase [Hyphomicrobiales bacterium]
MTLHSQTPRRDAQHPAKPFRPQPGRVSPVKPARPLRPLYTPEQRLRRDASRWTLVQGVLAPLQFLVCLVSVGLILRYLATGEGLALAASSVVLKTVVLYAIMITGSIWEKEVFGRYLFAEAFYWEDMVSMLVLALHTAYLAAWFGNWLGHRPLMVLALCSYASYAINAAQFVLKLRAARLSAASPALSELEPAL